MEAHASSEFRARPEFLPSKNSNAVRPRPKKRKPRTLAKWCQDTSDPRHFGPKTFWHHCDGAKVSGHFGTGAEVSYGHFGTIK